MIIWTKLADTVIASSLTETSCLDTGAGFKTMNPNAFYAGKTINLFLGGSVGTLTAPTLRIRVKLGSLTVLDSGTITLASAVSGGLFWLQAVIICRSSGASGSGVGQGLVLAQGTILPLVGAVGTIDTTVAQAIDITAQWGTANVANTLTLETGFIEVMV